MVNSKNVAFKVNKQTPQNGPPPQAFGTVINCRKPGGRRALRAEKEEVKSQRVRLTKIADPEHLTGKRKRGNEEEKDAHSQDQLPPNDDPFRKSSSFAVSTRQPSPEKPQPLKPTKLRRGKVPSQGVDIDCWHTILSFSDPAQLLELRTKISSCYRFLRDYPMLWKHSRAHYYNDSLPDPPSELTEFQYAHLRHGHGCMSCGTKSTRKTYWAFLRRWCKKCLQTRTIKEGDALALFKDEDGQDLPSSITSCLPSGIFDSWGNFVGVGPATTHSLKTVYLASDVHRLIAEFLETRKSDPTSVPAWTEAKAKVVEERREFARKMELWEDGTRQATSHNHSKAKAERRTYFTWKACYASELSMSAREVELCPSYRRAVAIPKTPNMTSWLQLKPKLEKEVKDLRAKGGPPAHGHMPSASGTSTPNTDVHY
jgi:hypothetical protein